MSEILPCAVCGGDDSLFDRDLVRFMDNVQILANGCWYWAGTKSQKGYGQISINNAHMQAHRYSYAKFNGYIPSGRFVCHTCDNPACVNPFHLFCGTAQDNTDDMIKKGRQPMGSRQGAAKVKEHDVWEMRLAYLRGEGTQKEIGERYGLSDSAATSAITGQTWKHVPMPTLAEAVRKAQGDE